MKLTGLWSSRTYFHLISQSLSRNTLYSVFYIKLRSGRFNLKANSNNRHSSCRTTLNIDFRHSSSPIFVLWIDRWIDYSTRSTFYGTTRFPHFIFPPVSNLYEVSVLTILQQLTNSRLPLPTQIQWNQWTTTGLIIEKEGSVVISMNLYV